MDGFGRWAAGLWGLCYCGEWMGTLTHSNTPLWLIQCLCLVTWLLVVQGVFSLNGHTPVHARGGTCVFADRVHPRIHSVATRSIILDLHVSASQVATNLHRKALKGQKDGYMSLLCQNWHKKIPTVLRVSLKSMFFSRIETLLKQDLDHRRNAAD